MLVYVNKVYLLSDVISKIEIIIHDEVNLKNVYYTDDYVKAVEFCKKLKSEGHTVYPLSGQHFMIDPSVEKIKISEDTIVDCGVKEETFIDTVYGLYSTLARSGAVLISDNHPYDNGYVGLVSEFCNLDISSSNMEVTIPIMYGNSKVGDFTLISQKGEIVLNNKFKVAVPKDKLSKVYKYNLSEISDIVLNNKEFTILEYLKDLTIFREIDVTNVPYPIIVRYIAQKQFYTEVSSLMKNVMLKMNIGSFKDFNDNKIKFSDLFNNNSGVFFRYDKSLSKDDLEKLTDLILKIGPSVMGDSSLDSKNVSVALKKILKSNSLDERYYKLLLVLFNIYKYSKSRVDLINSIMVNYSTLKIILLEIDLYLYTMRLGIYNNCKTLYPGQSYVQIESYGVKVGMEVWRK